MQLQGTPYPLPTFDGYDPEQRAVLDAELAELARLRAALGEEGADQWRYDGRLQRHGEGLWAVFGDVALQLYCQRLHVVGEDSITDYLPVVLAGGELIGEFGADGSAGVMHLVRLVRYRGRALQAGQRFAGWQAQFLQTPGMPSAALQVAQTP